MQVRFFRIDLNRIWGFVSDFQGQWGKEANLALSALFRNLLGEIGWLGDGWLSCCSPTVCTPHTDTHTRTHKHTKEWSIECLWSFAMLFTSLRSNLCYCLLLTYFRWVFQDSYLSYIVAHRPEVCKMQFFFLCSSRTAMNITQPSAKLS
jgi:hypothetical protein